MDNTREQVKVRRERAALVAAQVRVRGGAIYNDLCELKALAESAGAIVVDQFQQKISRINPSTYIGRGIAEMLKDRIDHVLKTLTYREREIIKLRYGIGDGYTYTLEEVGRIFKVTRERVRQVEAKAIRKLQHPVRSRKLEGFLDHKSA